jgi:hypothetical protein
VPERPEAVWSLPDVVFGPLSGETEVQGEFNDGLFEFIGAAGVEPQVFQEGLRCPS